MTRRSAGRPWWTLAALVFALFMVMLDMTIVNVALPAIQRDLAATPGELEWIVNAFALALATLILLGGKLGDRFGRRAFFLLGLVVFTTSSAACALSTSAMGLIAARAAQGIGGALMVPLSLSILVATFPRARRTTAIGIWAGVSALGLAVGPLVGGFLVEQSGWAAVFWINVPVGIVGFVASLWLVGKSRDPSTKSLDLLGAVLATGGLFALVWGLIDTSSMNWTSPEVLVAVGFGVVLLAGFLVLEARSAEPMLPLRFFRSRAFSLANAVVMMIGFALAGSVYFLALYLQNVMGFSAVDAGIRTLPLTLMIILIAPLAGRLNLRVGPRGVLTAGLTLAATGLAGLSRLAADSPYDAVWPWLTVLGCGIALTMPASHALAMVSVDEEKAGVASGALNTFRQVGMALGIAVLGSIAATIVRGEWTDFVATLPAAVQERASALVALVVGGQGRAVGQIVDSAFGAAAGSRAQAEALTAFVTGAQAAFAVAAAIALIGAVTVFVGLRRHGTGDEGREGAVSGV